MGLTKLIRRCILTSLKGKAVKNLKGKLSKSRLKKWISTSVLSRSSKLRKRSSLKGRLARRTKRLLVPKHLVQAEMKLHQTRSHQLHQSWTALWRTSRRKRRKTKRRKKAFLISWTMTMRRRPSSRTWRKRRSQRLLLQLKKRRWVKLCHPQKQQKMNPMLLPLLKS